MAANTDEYIEKLIFFHVIKDFGLTNKYRDIYFSSEGLRKLFGLIKPYVMQYREEPNEELVNMLIRQDGQYVKDFTPDIIHSLWQIRRDLSQYSDDWLNTTAVGFAEWNNFMHGLNKMHSYLLTTQYEVTPETAHEYVQKVKMAFSADTNFSMSDNLGMDFFDPRSHKMSIVETKPTGYKFFDDCLDGGWAKKTFNVIMGPPKVGKSMWLCNLAANSVMNGENSIYITLEMSAEKVNQRIGSNLLNIPIYEYKQYAADEAVMSAKLRDFVAQCYGTTGKVGALVVREFPTSSATVSDIESFILNIEKSRSTETVPFKFRNVYIDYVNIMADQRHGNSADTYIKIKSICEDCRAMCQRNDWCGVSLTQTNRQGMGASDLDMTAVSESSGLIATVDSLFGIICTTIMKAQGIYYIKALALRDSPLMGDRKKYLFSGDYLRIKEDPNEPPIPDGQPLPSELCGVTVDNNQNAGKRPWTPNKSNNNSAQQNQSVQVPGQNNQQVPQTTTVPLSTGTSPVTQFPGTGFNPQFSNSSLFA